VPHCGQRSSRQGHLAGASDDDRIWTEAITLQVQVQGGLDVDLEIYCSLSFPPEKARPGVEGPVSSARPGRPVAWLEWLRRNFNWPAPYNESFAVNQSFSHFPAARFQNPGQSGPRDLHFVGGLLLIKPFQVDQPDGFEFVQVQSNEVC